MSERELLASVGGSLHEQDAYEETVIREATQQLAPTLTGIGFPGLESLAPSYNALRPDAPYNPSDLPYFYSLLSKTRRNIYQLEQQSKTNSMSLTKQSTLDRLLLKEQLLLSYLIQVAKIPTEDLPIRLPEERSREAQRSSWLQRQGRLQTAAAISRTMKPPPDSSTSFSSSFLYTGGAGSRSTGNTSRFSRVPMMKRKHDELTAGKPYKCDDEEDDAAAETQERKEQLKKLRMERKRRRLERKRALEEWDEQHEEGDNNAEGETQFGTSNESNKHDNNDESIYNSKECPGEEKKELETAVSDEKQYSVSPVSEAGAEGEPTESTDVTTAPTSSTVAAVTSVSCPLCLEEILIDDQAQTDEALSKHMDRCQRRGRPTRRRAATVKSYSEFLDNDCEFEQKASKNSKNQENTQSDPLAESEERKKKSTAKAKKTATSGPAKRSLQTKTKDEASKSIDDLDESHYEDRVDEWIESGISRMKKMKERDVDDVPPGEEEYPGGLWVPAWINDRLFEYQRVALRWMWELHQLEAGGLIGDEMGLGKTVQVSSYLGVLTSNRKVKAVLVVSPATMLQHWLNELALWAPGLRRVLIHSSGETDGNSRSVTPKILKQLCDWLKNVRSDRLFEAIDDEDRTSMPPHSFPGTGYVVVTTYESLRRNPDIYTAHPWSYIVLDEAQKIRNPDADVTLACKRIRTPHRIAMSGTPIQNDLRELWSLFDFCFPGRLGTLPAFEQEFSEPIRRGGYSNATPVQVQLAYRCSLVLKDLIDPYLMRRRKKEVKEVSRMPSKTEHVLFCRLSQRQRAMYEAFLRSEDVNRVLRGGNQLFAAVTMLRKICNHPDLVCDPDQYENFLQTGTAAKPVYEGIEEDDDDTDEVLVDDNLANEESLVERGGKLEVLSKILPLWHEQGHRVLIFCQWKKMLNIIQKFTMAKGWKFGRLDGNTNVSARQKLVDKFNSDMSYYGMLCTTRTGGVGLNLTGANRIILYDPDWNPQTDAQARERAWRFGQEREVTIYRLITAGTVEEKIYQRQIFKTALSNRILQDPRQRRLFSQKDLKDLFTLKDDGGSMRAGADGVTETVVATRGVGQVDPVEDPAEESTGDNEATLKSVLKSKGLAGIFDHNFIEQDPTRKSVTTKEMEEQAKRIAREAAHALRHSVSSSNRFEPTWTGSKETETNRFGSSRNNGMEFVGNGDACSGQQGSSGLLASLRQRNAAVESRGTNAPPTDEAIQYAKLLARIKDFVRLRKPTTEELLEAFSDVPTSDVAIFRRLLKSVAEVVDGRWTSLKNS